MTAHAVIADESQRFPYLQGLNDPQRDAVLATDGPLLVLAGAGTGKTRVLTTRLAHILRTGKSWPNQILAVTFTNKAAQEMKERVSAILDGMPVEGWWLGTFHALAARMLRRHADLVGLDSNFTIIDTDDQIRLLKQLMEERGLDTKKWPPRQMIWFIERWKDKGLNPSDVPKSEGAEAADGHILALYARYQDRLRQINACDFGDLLLHMVTILKNPAHADVLADYHRRFKYVLVDEYQDTNVAQYLWLRLLGKGTGNVCCVGDDDQSIYGWRGAEVGNILKFEKDFPGAKIVRLEQNYRSTGRILAAASGVIACNEGRLGKTLWSENEDGEKLCVRGLWDGEAEARWVAEETESLQHKGWSLGQIAVLVRAGFQTREFEERFMQLGINYRVIGGQRFYERLEIRDALAYLRVVAQPADDLALERIINTPKRGIGDATVQTLYAYARAQGISLRESISHLCETDELKPKMRVTLSALIGNFARWRSLVGQMPHPELAAQILDESGYMQMWKTDKSPEAPGRLENLRELVSAMAEFESLAEFLEHIALVLENQGEAADEAISIMTLHGAKGLEFDAVFLPGWEEGLFPSQKTMDEHGVKGLEEERRLAYVGITRARKRAYVSYAARRRMYGNWIDAIPSRFVDELPEEHIEINTDLSAYGQGRSHFWDSSGFTPAVQRRTPPRPSGERAGVRGQTESASGFKRGARVMHDKFGPGTVINIDGHKLDIAFDRGGQKRVMDSFVELVEG
ncbi:MAG: DNA helicase II [Alphaproteobacteria bacterium]|nr:DNA helicase II [Alphaproteobacteria bacterium]